MKSKISLFNKAVIKHNFTGGWCLWAGVLMFYLLVLPISIYGTLSDILRYNDSVSKTQLRDIMMSVVWGNMGLLVPFFALAALGCAMYVFSYLFTARNSNMMHTFPVSRLSLFVTNFVTGLLFLIIPMVLSAFLALAAGAAYGAVNGEIVKYYLIWMVTAAVENLFFFSMAVCVLMFVGNMVAVPVLYLILNFLYDGCILIGETMLSIVCYCLESYALSGSKLGVLTPIVYLSRRIGMNTRFADESDYYTFQNLHVLPGYFAAGLLFIVIAVIVYQKKNIETAGDVITVKWLKPVFRWGTAICTSALLALFLSGILSGRSFVTILGIVIVSGAIIFFIAQMLLERSMHIFTKKTIRECIVYTVIISALYLAMDFDLFGVEKKMPSMDNIQAVKMSGFIDLYAYEDEEISWICKIHSQIIDSRKEFKQITREYDQNAKYVSIDYLLKDDTTFRRVYEIPDSNEKDSVSQQIWEYGQQPEVQLKQIFGVHYPEIEIYGGTWETEQADGSSKEIRISEADAKQLYEAIVLDVNHAAANNATDNSRAEADERDGIRAEEIKQTFGYLTLDIRDEAGYIDMSGNSVRIYQNGRKDGRAYISVDETKTRLVEKLCELGYMEKKTVSRSKG